MRAFVTGAAGFIGSSLVDRLLAANHTVVGYDNFSTGRRPFLNGALKSARFQLVEGDLLDKDALRSAMSGCQDVFHLAANADVRFGTHHPFKDLEQNTIATYNVLEAMRAMGVKRIAFSSTGSVYGEATVFPTPEDAPFPVQTSLYGNSKVAAEGLISSYCEGFGFQGLHLPLRLDSWRALYPRACFRFLSKAVWPIRRKLDVLGNGKQRKSYLYVQDCIDAILIAIERATDRVNYLQSWPGRILRSQPVDRLDLRASAAETRA